jgi:hypothetical protein
LLILFEDNENKPISQLLKKSYFGDSMQFSSGASRLNACVQNYLKRHNDLVLVFVDVIPTNAITLKTYNELALKYAKTNNVFIVPIPCIEYIVLQFLGNTFNAIHEQKSVRSLLYDFSEEELLKVRGRGLEHKIKNILNDCRAVSYCFLNDTNREGDMRGKFYLSPCDCEFRMHSSLSLSDKADELYRTLPIYVLNNGYKEYLNKSNKKFTTDNFNVLLNRVDLFYTDLCNKLGVDVIDIYYKSEE